jgi:hypothetical protein
MPSLLLVVSWIAYLLVFAWGIYELTLGRATLKKLREGKVRTNQGWMEKADIEEIEFK